MKHRSRLTGVLVVLCVVVAMASPALAQLLTLEAKDAGGTVKTQFAKGDDLYLHINLTNAGGVAGCAFTLNFPANVLQPPATTDGLPVISSEITSAFPFIQTFPEGTGLNPEITHRENSSESGKIYFAGAQIAADGGAVYDSGQVTLFTVKFKVKADAPAGAFSPTLTQTELFNPAAGYGTDANSNGIFDAGDTKGKVPVLVGAVAEGEEGFNNLNCSTTPCAFPVLLGDQTQPLASLQLDVFVDTDGDGLSDSVETNTGIYNGPADTGTDPDVADTDGDGLTDGQEVLVHNTNPLNLDTDGDGLTDGQEVSVGRNPVVKDNVFGSGSAVISNNYLRLDLGKRFNYTGIGALGGYGRYIKAVGVEGIDTVNCLKVAIRGAGGNPKPDLDPEWYSLWLAQDTSGVVWLLQYYDSLSDTTTPFGKANALVWMPANPMIGQRYFQDGTGYCEVIESGVTVSQLSTGLGPYSGCLKVMCTDGEGENFSYMAPNVGVVKEEWNESGTDGWDLSEVVKDELVVDFGTPGLYHYNGATLKRLHKSNADGLATYGSKLAANLPSLTPAGLYGFDGASWEWLGKNDVPEGMCGTESALYVDFGSAGLHKYDGTWKRINANNPEGLWCAAPDVFVDFGAGIGLYKYDGTWKLLTKSNPEDLCVVGSTVYADLGVGIGLYKYDGTTWTRINKMSPEAMSAVGEELYVDFGAGVGLYKYNGTLTRVSKSDPEEMLGVGTTLYVDFGTLGLYKYENGVMLRIHKSDVAGMGSYADKLVVNFPSVGLYEFDGVNWKRINPTTAEEMISVDLY